MTTIRFAAMLALAGLACARTHSTFLEWKALPRDLTGRKVQVVSADRKSANGTVERVTPAGLELRNRKGTISLPAANVTAISWKERKHVRWSIGGAAIGAAPGVAATGLLTAIARNETGGSWSPTITGIAVAGIAGGAVLGYLPGRMADTDTFEIRITPPK